MSENTPASNELNLSDDDLDAVSGGGLGGTVEEDTVIIITETTIIVP